MASVQDMVESFFIMIIFVIVGFVMLMAISVPWDMMAPTFVSAGFENVPTRWDTFDDRDWLAQLILIIAYGLFILGPLQFVIVCVRTQEYDQYVFQR